MKQLSFRLQLTEPCLIGGVSSDPNSSTSLSYLSGSTLRGALISELARQGLDLDPTAALAPYLNGEVRVLNAYPSAPGVSLYPTPLAWRTEKRGRQLFDWSFADDQLDRDPQRAYTLPAPTFIDLDRLYTHSPKRSISVHTARSKKYGRATATEGQVFRYDALAKDQAFQGRILFKEPYEEELRGAFRKGQQLSLGKARSAGFGAATLLEVELSDVDVVETPHLAELKKGSAVTAYLASDLILRSSAGSPGVTPQVFLEALNTALGDSFFALSASLYPNVFMRTAVVAGLNHTWGLPLPQQPAFAMGSCFCLTVIKLASEHGVSLADALLSLQQRGLGERLAEGFGRVGFYQPKPLGAMRPVGLSTRLRRPPLLSEDHKPKARMILASLIEQDMRSFIINDINRLEAFSLKLSKSQLGSLREAVRRAQFYQDPKLALAYLDKLELRPRLKSRYESSKFWSGTFYTWLTQRLKAPETLLSYLGTTNALKDYQLGAVTLTPAQQEALLQKLSFELIDGVLSQHMRKKRGH